MDETQSTPEPTPSNGLFAGLLRILGLRQTVPENPVSGQSDLDASFVMVAEGNETSRYLENSTRGTAYLTPNWSKPIAEGSFGVVYLCQDLFGQEYILKSLKNFTTVEEDWCKEQQLLFSLFHPNIIRIFDAFQFEDYFYIVMEKADGDLRGYVAKNGKLPTDQVVRIGAQILSALACIHHQNIIHRDLHIDNILYIQNNSNLSIKVADFGISKQLLGDEDLATSIVGRDWDYSPELVTHQYATKKSDLYQTGVVLYYCLTGEMPIQSSDGVCESVTISGLARERALALGTPIGDVVANLLHVDPALRYESALATWQALKECK